MSKRIFIQIFGELNRYAEHGRSISDNEGAWWLNEHTYYLYRYKFWGRMSLPIQRALIRAVRSACDNNHSDVLRILLGLHKNININKRDQFGDTILTRAVKNSNSSIVKILLYNGASPNILNFSGYTPLMLAAHYEKVEIVEVLMEHNPDVSIKSRNGSIAIEFALARQNHLIAGHILRMNN
jgi:hypothetical protein